MGYLTFIIWIFMEFIQIFFKEIVQMKKGGQFFGTGENLQSNVHFRCVESTIAVGSIRMLYSKLDKKKAELRQR